MSDRGQLLAAARRRLLADTGFQALIAAKDVGKDTNFTSVYPDQAYADGWLGQGIDQDGRPARDVAATGTSFVTLNCRSGWTTPNDHNTSQFPQLVVFIWSDLTRPTADNGMISARDALARCGRVAEVVVRVFHRPQNDGVMWGDAASFPPNGVWVHKSLQGMSLNVTDVASSDGVVKGEVRFNLTTD